jgi:hypothetical protein
MTLQKVYSLVRYLTVILKPRHAYSVESAQLLKKDRMRAKLAAKGDIATKRAAP